MSDKQREAFELWARKRGYDLMWSEKLKFYATLRTRLLFDAWKSAIDSVVVELPVTCYRTHVFELPYTGEVGMEHDEYFEVDDIKSALDASGVKYK